MGTSSLLVQQILDVLDVLIQRTDELSLPDLELLEEGLTVALRENIVEAIANKQVDAVFQGYAVDPTLPEGFSHCPNDERPESHRYWVRRPYILTRQFEGKPCYWVQCLDGGAWDRPTWWGEAETLEAAAKICRNGPNWTKPQ